MRNVFIVNATLETAQGRTVMQECIGAFPDMTPEPEPEEPVEE